MFVQAEFAKPTTNNNNLTRGADQDNGTSDLLLEDLDLVSRFCLPICSHDNEVREVALDAISKTVESWLDGMGSPMNSRCKSINERTTSCNNIGSPPAEYMDLVALHLPIILRLSLNCPFANVREKCQHILEIVRIRGLPIPHPVIFGPSAFVDAEEILIAGYTKYHSGDNVGEIMKTTDQLERNGYAILIPPGKKEELIEMYPMLKSFTNFS